MKWNKNMKWTLGMTALLISSTDLWGQNTLNLNQLTDSALTNNRLIKMKAYELDEKAQEVKEMQMLRYPMVNVTSMYLYNVNVGELTVPQGALGSLQTSATTTTYFPSSDIVYPVGQNNMFNASAILYQPISQQFQIGSGIKIAQTEQAIVALEGEHVADEIEKAIQNLYFGILINQKQQDEVVARLEVVQIELKDVQSAIDAGKTTEVIAMGLQAKQMSYQQDLLKLQIQSDDYWQQLKSLAALPKGDYVLEDWTQSTELLNVKSYSDSALTHNIDLQKAELMNQKANQAVKATQQGYIPDFGLIAGYTYQYGIDLLPENMPFFGVSLRWDVKGVFENKVKVEKMKVTQQKAEENLAYTQEEVQNQVEMAYRKVIQSSELIQVAQKVMEFRLKSLNLIQDKKAAGLTTDKEVFEAQAEWSKSQADFYAATLGYNLAVLNLNILVGK